MKKVIVALAAVALAGAASADIFAGMFVNYGVYGNGDGGGIIDNINGTEVVLQVLAGGGDGLQGPATYDAGLGEFVGTGNDAVLFQGSLFATGGGDFVDYGVGGYGQLTTANTPDTWVRLSGIGQDDWVYQVPVSFLDLDSTDPLVLPQAYNIDFDDGTVAGSYIGNTTDGSVTVNVVPEPATIGLMGIAGLGMFLARRKRR